MKYHGFYQEIDTDYWLGQCIELPECLVHGLTKEEAQKELKDLLDGYTQFLQERYFQEENKDKGTLEEVA